MTSISRESVESTATQPAEERAVSVSGTAPTPTPPAPAVRPPNAPTALTVREARPTTHTAPPPARAPAPSPTTALIANLQGCDVAAVEAVVVGVAQAFQRGDQSAVVERLAEQATLLTALGVKLLNVAGRESMPQVIQIYTNLALRAIDSARKTLATLNDMRGAPRSQVNLQVNVDGRGSNEILGA